MMPYLQGLGVTLSMIAALGPQNAYLIRRGLIGDKVVFNIAAIYIFIDLVLITSGVIGIGALIGNVPILKLLFSIIASVFFFIYGVISIDSASKLRKESITQPPSGATSYTTAVLVSIANPSVLFETVFIIGGIASQYDLLSERVTFSAGAATASIFWFSSIAFLSLYISRFMFVEKIWELISLVIGAFMISLSIYIGLSAVEMYNAMSSQAR